MGEGGKGGRDKSFMATIFFKRIQLILNVENDRPSLKPRIDELKPENGQRAAKMSNRNLMGLNRA